jgi:hypothetical protein
MTKLLDQPIREKAETYADDLMVQIRTIETEYWAAVHSLASNEYDSKSRQYDDIKRISKLGIALTSLVKSHHDMNFVRWDI